MKQEELRMEISNTEREIARLPEGSIAKKTIKGRDYYYHRISRDGKRIEKYISFELVDEMRAQINRRKQLEKYLKELRVLLVEDDEQDEKQEFSFRTTVRYGRQLRKQIATVMTYKKRECISALRDYIFGDQMDKVFILYGLRRTGKTTLIRQMISELSKETFKQTAFIQVNSRNSLIDVDEDLRLLEKEGFKYIFIDEITMLEDFIEGAALFSDIYASSGMKIVLSGTDSLGFAFSKEGQLYNRCILLHTTFIPYREFEEVLGIKGIDEYIRYGGTMSLGGVNYNSDAPFANLKNAEEYVDSAIARNIQHSLRMYQYGGHFRQLLELYETGELTNVINRVVENINHSFARSVVEKAFQSHDLSMTTMNLLRDRNRPINMKNHMDLETVTLGIKQMLEILDIVSEIDLEYLPEVNQKGIVTVITQPGIRYAQASAIVENLLLDAKFQELSVVERKYILERLLNEIRGRMLEEIILLETKIAKPDKKVCKLQFAIGEFDMVVYDTEELTCEIYEIKYSKEIVPEQCRHILDEEKCAMTIHRYGDIKGRYVIYRGETCEVDGVKYLNAEEYLKSLYS